MNRRPLISILDGALWMAIIGTLLWAAAIFFTCRAHGADINGGTSSASPQSNLIPSSPQLAPKFKPVKTWSTVPLLKGATLLTGSYIRQPYTNAPVRFLAVSRGPSPYDGLANVETILVGTVQLDGTVKWEVLQTGQTNRFIVGNTNNQQYFNMAFGFIR